MNITLKEHKKLIHKVSCILVAFFISLSMIPYPLLASGQLSDPGSIDSTNPNFTSFSDIQPNNNSVIVGLWLINLFSYQYITSDYTMDMYLYFFWRNTNVTAIDWDFANGYPITPTSITLLNSNYTSTVRYEVYRATARFNSPPDASDFPFDKINLTISINLLTHGNNITLNWLNNQTGVDPQFTNPGWKTVSVELDASIHTYPLGVQVPRADMVIIQQRQRAVASISPFIPPTIFALVCAVSFLFGLKEMGSVGLRIGLNTSMLVTTLLFSFGVNSSIPQLQTWYYTLYTCFVH